MLGVVDTAVVRAGAVGARAPIESNRAVLPLSTAGVVGAGVLGAGVLGADVELPMGHSFQN
ncbi:MAG: hypothetical protein CMM81_16565 [Rhodospirillales bacterium]|nr:hypothetical protein [Rhodospirillales bacterium]